MIAEALGPLPSRTTQVVGVRILLTDFSPTSRIGA
jgi:hypothetical protein